MKLNFANASDALQKDAGLCRYALKTFDRIRSELADDEDVAAARRRARRAVECLDERLDAIATRRALGHLDARGAPEEESVFAAHEGRAVFAFELADRGRDVADRKPDAAIEARVRRRAVHKPHMVQRHLAGPQVQRHRLRFIDLD